SLGRHKRLRATTPAQCSRERPRHHFPQRPSKRSERLEHSLAGKGRLPKPAARSTSSEVAWSSRRGRRPSLWKRRARLKREEHQSTRGFWGRAVLLKAPICATPMRLANTRHELWTWRSETRSSHRKISTTFAPTGTLSWTTMPQKQQE